MNKFPNLDFIRTKISNKRGNIALILIRSLLTCLDPLVRTRRGNFVKSPDCLFTDLPGTKSGGEKLNDAKSGWKRKSCDAFSNVVKRRWRMGKETSEDVQQTRGSKKSGFLAASSKIKARRKIAELYSRKLSLSLWSCSLFSQSAAIINSLRFVIRRFVVFRFAQPCKYKFVTNSRIDILKG